MVEAVLDSGGHQAHGPDVDGGCAKHRQVSWFCWKWFFTWVNRQSESSMQADFPFFLGDSSRTKEFEIMKGVCHPNLVQALDYFQHPCGSALVLSYIPSVTLTAAVRSTTHKHTTSTTFLSEGKAKSLFRMLLDALSYLHHRRIIHSDAWCIEMLKGSERPFCTLKLTYESEVYTRRHFRVWVINWLIHSFINYIYIYTYDNGQPFSLCLIILIYN